MPATPAWPPQSAPRLYVDAPLGEGAVIPLDGNQAHYLISVMRVKEGDIVLLFDNRTGEWAAEARNIRKRDIALHIVSQTKPLETVPDLWLCVAPIKRSAEHTSELQSLKRISYAVFCLKKNKTK